MPAPALVPARELGTRMPVRPGVEAVAERLVRPGVPRTGVAARAEEARVGVVKRDDTPCEDVVERAEDARTGVFDARVLEEETRPGVEGRFALDAACTCAGGVLTRRQKNLHRNIPSQMVNRTGERCETVHKNGHGQRR